jgi:multidrug resistance efflux pump
MPTNKKEYSNRWVIGIAAFIVVVIGGGIVTLAVMASSAHSISIDQAHISAPTVDLSSSTAGPLRTLNVSAGQVIPPNTVVAQVGVELIKSIQGGLVLSTNGGIGDQVPAGQTVVETIDPAALRVVGQVDENKGLNRIKIGDPVTFTVDAFGGQQFTGMIDEIAPTSNQSGVVFNISDQRQVQQFDVKAHFDTTQYPQIKNGMSARMTIYVQ